MVLGPSELRGRDFIHEWHGASDWLKYQTPSPLWGVAAGGGGRAKGAGGQTARRAGDSSSGPRQLGPGSSVTRTTRFL